MEPTHWIAIAGITATLLASVATHLINRYREKRRWEREDRLRHERWEKERTYKPHIEFGIDCNFYGPGRGYYLTEFLLRAHNKGAILQQFPSILLRVRGIKHDQAPEYWSGREPRVEFPEKVIDETDIIPRDYNYFFVEPGVRQTFTYVTRTPASIKYVLVQAKFTYDEFTPHTVERVFLVGG